ncbi:hypothetical protein BEN47_17485 [Hymenobacter lapidarius]|uniref:DUF7677 domain-containing protein n=1 Tax=Hymenobacter lapidarius TaxID=1908237 RepID=A0A1G1SY27_9BACT|nr:hypothetical protein [Hymenobacter lapidarius]OGX83527.1 hypothetical protein BEN47_17485 [Hymenobacter lapidarius]
MRLPDDDPLDIQCFVYYLFRGSLHSKLIGVDYVFRLVREPQLLENAFRLFTEALRQHAPGGRADNRATEYLVAYFVTQDLEQAQTLLATAPVDQPDDVYAHFFQLACHFIHNTFADPIQSPHYLFDLDGCGTDAVPAFAVWTNVVNALAPDDATAYARALRRANDRARVQLDGYRPQEPFSEWEWEQEIY